MIGTTAAIIASAAIGAGSAALSSRSQSKAISKATDAQTASNDKALDLQNQQYQQQRADYAPWRTIGVSALQQLARVHGYADPTIGSQYAIAANTQPNPTTSQPAQDANGAGGAEDFARGPGMLGRVADRVRQLNGTTTDAAPATTTVTPTGIVAPAATGDPAYGGFFESPDYKYRKDQSLRAVTGNYAARGLLDSGQGLGEGLMATAGNMASQEFGSWYNRIAALAGVGQTATDSTTQAGQNAVNAQSGILQNQGNNLASSYAAQGQVNSGLISGLGGIASGLLTNYGGNSSGYSPTAPLMSTPNPTFVAPPTAGSGYVPNGLGLYGSVI